MKRSKRPLMPRVHGREHVERLTATAFAHDDAVGAHAKRVRNQIANGDFPHPFRIARTSLKAHDVRVLQKAQLSGVLYRDDSLIRGNVARKGIKKRCFAASRSTGNSDALASANSPDEQALHAFLNRAALHHVLQGDDPRGERSDREHRAVERKRRHDGVHAMPLRKAGVHHRRRLVDSPTERADDAVDEHPHLVIAREAKLASMQNTVALIKQRARPVHHDLGDRLIREKRFERPESQHGINQGVGERFLLRKAGIEAPASLERCPANRSDLVARPLGIALGERRYVVSGKLLANSLLQPLEHFIASRPRSGRSFISRRPHTIEKRHGSTPSRRARLKEKSPREGASDSSDEANEPAASPATSPISSLTLSAKGLREETKS